MLDPRPVVLYLPKYDDYLVVWNGAIMPLVHAQYIAAWWMGIYVSKSVITELDQRYYKLYYAGAFGEQDWDHMIESGGSTFGLLRSIMATHCEKFIPGCTGEQILSWFDLKTARIKDTVEC